MATTTVDGEDRVMAAAQQIVKSLNTSKDVTDDMLLIFSNFDNRLSNISDVIEGEARSLRQRFEAAEMVVLQAEQSWSEQWPEFLSAVDEVVGSAERLALGSDGGEVVARAEVAIQVAMARLEEEFRQILGRSAVPLDSGRLLGSIRRVNLSFNSGEGEGDGMEGLERFTEEGQGGCYHERGRSLAEEVSLDLIHGEAVVELRDIADRMLRSGYEKECCQVYSSVRRDAMDDCLQTLGVERLSIEEVLKIEWRSLDERMKRWIQALKIVVRVLLAGEKRLCDRIFGGSNPIKEVCFIETSKGSVMQLLNFAEAVAIGRRSSEKLFRILDMHDAIAGLFPEIEAMFAVESGEFVRVEARGVLASLGGAVRGTFVEFETAVQGETSKKPVHGGEIHPLTRYVMNYMKLLVDYSDSLNSLLKNEAEEEEEGSQREDGENPQVDEVTPLGTRLMSLISFLESNLEDKSKVYEDPGMQYVFLMNNILYIVQRVKDSDLGRLLGDRWIRKRRGQVRQYATGYLRASWSKTLSCLKDEGISVSSSSASKVALKERFKHFNANFEEVYRIQTAWKVPDPQLREELRISISEKVLPAYRSFVGRFRNHLESGRHTGKYIKYTPDDLETYLLDLFEGTPSVLHHTRRRSG